MGRQEDPDFRIRMTPIFRFFGLASQASDNTTIPLPQSRIKLQDMCDAQGTPPAQHLDLDAACQVEQPECNHIPHKTSVIERLPHEILACIFEEAYSLENGLELLFSQVTSQWRNVAINTPRLWRSIHLLVDRPPPPELAALYLTRSKVTPIDITVTQNLYDDQNGAFYGKLLADHIHRCRRLKLSVYSMESARTILDFLVVASAPLLQTFDAYLKSEQQPAIQILLGGTPVLAVMHLRASAGFLPPLYAVTTLHIHNIQFASLIELEHWRDILSSLTHLVSLVINGDFLASPIWTSGASITLPALRTLEINVVDLDEPESDLFECLYETIDAPLLGCLSLRNYTDDDLAFLEDSWHLGATKFPALHTLVLSGLGEEYTYLVPLVRAFPYVETVTFTGNVQANFHAVLQLLQRADGSDLYWPRFRHLIVSDMLPFDHDDMRDLLAGCLAARIIVEKPIETLTIRKSDVYLMCVDDDGLLSQTGWMDLVRVVEVEGNSGNSEA
ncbi:hypothetical protein HWV62_26300 [Athelia sp. TMB]|nr:hypothetical protein HWV62_26300 [Athelia sp. TMB]